MHGSVVVWDGRWVERRGRRVARQALDLFEPSVRKIRWENFCALSCDKFGSSVCGEQDRWQDRFHHYLYRADSGVYPTFIGNKTHKLLGVWCGGSCADGLKDLAGRNSGSVDGQDEKDEIRSDGWSCQGKNENVIEGGKRVVKFAVEVKLWTEIGRSERGVKIWRQNWFTKWFHQSEWVLLSFRFSNFTFVNIFSTLKLGVFSFFDFTLFGASSTDYLM